MKGISRIDSKSTHGWFVRVFRGGQTHSKFFSDGKHGGKQAALKVAKRYRDDYEREHPPSLFARRVRLKPQRNNKTGVPGVSETFHRSRNGNKLPCFSVSWNPQPNRPHCKKFYISHYGDREAALAAAIEFRKEKELEILRSITGQLGSKSKRKKRTRISRAR